MRGMVWLLLKTSRPNNCDTHVGSPLFPIAVHLDFEGELLTDSWRAQLGGNDRDVQKDFLPTIRWLQEAEATFGVP